MSSRVPPAPVEGDDAPRSAVERIQAMRSGEVSTLYRTLLNSPEIAAGWCALGTAIRWESSLDDSCRELVTCQVAARLGARYEWRKHEGLAKEQGVTDRQLATLPHWEDERSFTLRQRTALAFADAVTQGTVDDALFDQTEGVFGRQQTVELAATTAYYVCIARFLDACGVE